MGRKMKNKKKKKHPDGKVTQPGPAEAPGSSSRAGQPDLSHLSGEWREFYRLVIDRIS